MNFLEYYFIEAKAKQNPSVVDPDAWRDRRVWHTTPKTQKRSKIKIRYLPADEQIKYSPQWYRDLLKKRKAEAEAEGKNPDDIQIRVTDDGESKSRKSRVPIPEDPVNAEIEVDPYSMDFYYYVSDPKMFNVFEEGQITKATLDGAEIAEFEAAGKYVAEALYVPMSAVKAYKGDDGEWVEIPKMSDEAKYDQIRFGEAIWFKLDIYPALDKVKFNFLTDMSDSDETDVTIK